MQGVAKKYGESPPMYGGVDFLGFGDKSSIMGSRLVRLETVNVNK